MIWRIRERSAFERLARDGRRIRVTIRPDVQPAGVTSSAGGSDRPTVWCTHLPDPGAVPPRVAFAIGRAHGSAVHRNRLRRRLRALLAEASTAGRIPPGWYLIGGTPGLGVLTFEQLAIAIDELCDRVMTSRSGSFRSSDVPPASPSIRVAT